MQTAVNKVRVECADLAIGMYVCELDRPWQQTPFIIRGFYIKDINDIDTVRNFCEYVFVDKIVQREQLTKGLPGASSAIVLNMTLDKATETKPATRLSLTAHDDEGQQKQPYWPEQDVEAFFPGRKLVKYSNTVSWRDEAADARQVIRSLYDHIVRFLDISIDGNPLEFDKIRLAVEPMVDSVTRNPDACLWATSMKPPGEDSSDSALRASVFAVVLGRRLRLPHNDLCSLAMGGMLFDIGKLRLGDKILQADRKLTAGETQLMQRHVEIGLGILKRDGLIDQVIIDFVANHHERFDGSGYPKRLGGDMIPAFGRLAGVVDCYSAITGSRKYASSRSPAEAINQLYKLKSVHFHKDLIEEFIHAIGVYPVGALVELSSGEVAIVVAQSATRRLRPIVVVLLDGDKNKCCKGHYINLEKTTHQDDGHKLDIVKNLEPDAYGIDRSKIRLN